MTSRLECLNKELYLVQQELLKAPRKVTSHFSQMNLPPPPPPAQSVTATFNSGATEDQGEGGGTRHTDRAAAPNHASSYVAQVQPVCSTQPPAPMEGRCYGHRGEYELEPSLEHSRFATPDTTGGTSTCKIDTCGREQGVPGASATPDVALSRCDQTVRIIWLGRRKPRAQRGRLGARRPIRVPSAINGLYHGRDAHRGRQRCHRSR